MTLYFNCAHKEPYEVQYLLSGTINNSLESVKFCTQVGECHTISDVENDSTFPVSIANITSFSINVTYKVADNNIRPEFDCSKSFNNGSE